MEITPSSLAGMFTGYQVNFNQAYEAFTPWWDQVATPMPSATEQNTYAWMAQLPRMRPWLGERTARSIAVHPYTLVNGDWEETVEVPRNKILDDTYGVFAPLMASLGEAAKKWEDEMLRPVIEAGNTTLTFDGQNFFDPAHPIDVNFPDYGTQSNIFSTASGDARLLTPENFAYVRQKMRKFKGESNRAMNIRPTVLMVPPALEQMAKIVLETEFIANATQAGVTVVGPQTNIFKGDCKIIVNAELTSDTAWYLLDTSKAIKPFLVQRRQAPVFVPLTSPTDPNVYRKKIFEYGVDARGAAGFTLWFLAAKGDA